LDFSKSTVLVLSLFETDFFDALGMLFLAFFLSFDDGRLQQVETLVLESLNVVLALLPLADLVGDHQFAAQVEAGLIGGGREGVLEGTLLTHLFDQVHLGHGGG